MQIKLHNSLSRQIEVFKPVDEEEVKIYSCGPTVYNYAHIGNMRAFLFGDLLQRVVRVVGDYKVRWVMNITNIDDKTIRDSMQGSSAWLPEMGLQTDDAHKNLSKLSEFYLDGFRKDIASLGIENESFYAMPKATDYIPQMQELIKKIVDRGFAYVAGGSVYFDVAKWKVADTYGRLKKLDFDNFRRGERVDSDEYEREQVSDFVLWKALKDKEPFWDFEIDGQQCPGRPGWHIECSAMEKELLGLPFDIHTGGIDLKFPHHEDEIAQSKAGYGIDPTNYWCHNEFLEVEGVKMSKSAGNFFTLRQLLEKGLDSKDIRFFMLSTHYGTKFNFTFEGVKAAHKARMRVQEFIYSLHEDTEGTEKVNTATVRDKVFAEFAHDLHTPKALAALFTFINSSDPCGIDPGSKIALITFFTELNDIFAVWDISKKDIEIPDIPSDIIDMAQKRYDAKKAKNWAEADALRDQIKAAGYLVKDTKDSFEISKN